MDMATHQKVNQANMSINHFLQIVSFLLVFLICGINTHRSKSGMELIYIPAGESWEGSDEWDHEYKADEMPERKITLDAFWIDRTEVTNAMYAQCVKEGVCDLPCSSEVNSRFYDLIYANYPVVYVTWQDAMDYCNWLGGRLPTEAEWEKAARGTSRSKYPWQEGYPTAENVNAANTMGDTAPVGSYLFGASYYGVLDMAGNVREWVYDWYDEDYYSYAPLENPMGPATGTDKVLKGGSYFDNYEHTRVADRLFHPPDSAGINRGFRCSIPDK